MHPQFQMKHLFMALLAVSSSTAALAQQSDESQGATAKLQKVMVTSAAGFEQNIADAPASISVISGEELQKKSYTNITDAIKNIPGLYMTGGGGMGDISIRGLTSSYTLYLVDGRPISAGRSVNTNGSDGGKQIGLPPISMIERIEVIRGPMSSLYGSEAMGGVINIITRKSAGEWAGSITTEYTHSENDLSNDAEQVNFTASGGIIPGLLGLQVSGSYQGTEESDYQSVSGSASESTPDSTNKQASAKVFLTPNQQNEFSLGVTKATREYTHTPGKSLAPTAAGTYYRYDKDIYVLAHEGRYDNLQISTYYQRDVSDNVQANTKKEQVDVLNTQATWALDKHVVTFGGQYKQENLVDETNGLLTSNVDGAVREVDRWLAAAFTEVEWGLLDNFALTTGLRYNDDELFGGHLTPRVYGVYHATDNLTFKGGVSTGYVQPSLSSATPGFGRGTGGGGSPAPHPRALIIGNEDLKPETSTSYEIGYVYDNQELGFNTSLMIFQTDFEDKIAEDRYCDLGGDRNDPATWQCEFGGNNYLFLSTQKNIDDAEMRGVEITVDYALLPSLNLSSSYTYTESEQLSGDFKGQPLNKMPRNMFNASLDWFATEKLNLWAQYNYRGKTSDYLSRTAMADGTPAYGFFDVGLVYNLKSNVDVKAGIYNAGNKEVTNEEHSVVLDGRRVNLGLTINF